ncbi:MAG: molybdopterin-dependent oxidoreductase [Myxococcota bacterium]
MSKLDRRDFLKLVGAGAGAAAAAGCTDPVEKLIPYVIQPEEITPGIPVFYASTCRECPAGCGIHVKTREGRPIKLEGNPEHPINRGALCARGQAAIGRSYHPDRYASPMIRSDGALRSASWDEALGVLMRKITSLRGAGSMSRLRVIGADPGPTLSRLIDDWITALGGDPVAQRTVYEPFAHEALRAATEQVFGVASLPIFDLSATDLILDFGSDFLDAWLSPVEHARQFAEARDVEAHPDGGARLVSIGPRLSLTGSSADQWIPSAPGSEGAIALFLAAAVYERARSEGRSISGDSEAVARALSSVDRAETARRAGIDASTLDALVERVLAAHAPLALPPGVALTGQQATSSAAAVLLLDALVGAVGQSVQIPRRDGTRPGASLSELSALVTAMQAGEVDVLLVHDADPLYSLPGDLGMAEALAQVDLVVSFSPLRDETSERADLVLPDHTPLESWGDATPRPGVRSIVQPTLRPLHDTQALGDTLLALGRSLGEAVSARLPSGSFRNVLEAAWAGSGFRAALGRGGVFSDATPMARPPISSSVASLSSTPAQFEGDGDLVLMTFPHSYLWDGRGAALPWLQEIPDPVTKISWQSWAELSKSTAARLGVDFGDVVAVETGFGASRIELPVYPRGGIRDDVIAVAIGQGHTVGHYASLAGDGQPGVARGVNVLSVIPARSDERGGRAWLCVKASVQATGAYHRLPLSQWTDNQRGRGIAQEVSLLALAGGRHGEDHDGGHELLVEFDPANDRHPDSDYRWGMTIDTDRCNGCSACIAACYVENNVPVVGEEQVRRQRSMTWLRIERYIGEGDTEGGEHRRPHPDREELGRVEVRHAPMLCQHCGAAPCEPVCPVIATYHNPEGLNAMVYNRCVGTRYCANNCSYKVRRFNYYDYGNDNFPGLLGLMLNPDVTVRGQGVMEKCTFCVQRVEAARQPAKDAGRLIADGEVVTACQQSCPTRAISFGNTLDGSSQVVKKSHDPARAYHALHVLNTRPAVTYLAQVRREGDGRPHG